MVTQAAVIAALLRRPRSRSGEALQPAIGCELIGGATSYSVTMWRRFRRRSMAPSRPAVYPDQVGLAILSIAAIGFGIYWAIQAF